MQRFIVAEVTKNWGSTATGNELISEMFELVINANAARGYKLVDWKLNVSNTLNSLTETIVAIFESTIPIN